MLFILILIVFIIPFLFNNQENFATSMTKENIINLKKGQKVLNYMLKTFKNICDQHHIKYIIWGGTLIGAHYFQDFVPWDGDIDLMIDERDKEKFIEVMKNQLPKDLWFQSKETDRLYHSHIHKIRYLNGYYEGSEKFGWHGGLMIDICYFKIENGHFKSTAPDNDNFNFQEIKVNDIFPLKELKFNNIYLTTFNNYQKYLNIRYPNHQKYLPKEQQKPHEGNIIFGINDFHKKNYPKFYT